MAHENPPLGLEVLVLLQFRGIHFTSNLALADGSKDVPECVVQVLGPHQAHVRIQCFGQQCVASEERVHSC